MIITLPHGTAGYNFTADFWSKELGQDVAQMDGFDVAMYQFVPNQNLQFQARKVDGVTIGESAGAGHPERQPAEHRSSGQRRYNADGGRYDR